MKKKYIIIFSVLVFAAILIYFAVLIINKNNGSSTATVNNNGFSKTIPEQATSTLASSTLATSSQESNISTNNQAPIDVEAVNKKFLEYLPKTSGEQIELFSEIATGKVKQECESLSGSEADSCKYYLSVYANNTLQCSDITNYSLGSDCYKKLIWGELESKVNQCDKQDIVDNRANCFDNVFWGIENVDACDIFTNNSIHQFCVDSLNLKSALADNKNNCSKIKDTGLKTFCDNYFTPGDFDKDGLPDNEELKIGTNPYLADTDGDGYSDKAEIDKGYNPCGEGLMPVPAKLLEACAALKK